jgi:hypothetical protein
MFKNNIPFTFICVSELNLWTYIFCLLSLVFFSPCETMFGNAKHLKSKRHHEQDANNGMSDALNCGYREEIQGG